jgi:hypothetical protein
MSGGLFAVERARARMKKTLLALILGLAMLVPSAALAGSSSCQAYGNKTCSTSNTTSTTAPAPTTGAATTGAPAVSPGTTAATTTAATTASGTLPFTGLDLAALLVGASVLLGGGLVVRYLSRDQRN